MTPGGQQLTATILIATRDRKDELRRAITSALGQEGDPEILVMDDGSTDGTSEMVRDEFPTVRVVRSEISRGQCVQRNIGAALAGGDIVIGIDDDAFFVSRSTTRQTIADFASERVGVVAIPFSDHRSVGSWVEQKPPSRDTAWVTSTFVAAAYAVRRETFLDCGGFRESLFRAGEEGELSLRMLAAGLVTQLGTSDPMEHQESPRRIRSDILRLEARNEILIAWYLVPTRYLPVRWAKIFGNHLLLGIRRRMPLASARGVWEGVRSATSSRAARTPVSASAYRMFRRIQKHGPLQLATIGDSLAPLDPGEARMRMEPPSRS